MNLGERRKVIRRLNRDPLNEAAKRLLPRDYQSDDSIHCLSLIQWGLDNNVFEETKGHWPSLDAARARVSGLEKRDPEEAWAYLIETDSGEEWLDAGHLQSLDREEASAFLLQALMDKMVATRP